MVTTRGHPKGFPVRSNIAPRTSRRQTDKAPSTVTTRSAAPRRNPGTKPRTNASPKGRPQTKKAVSRSTTSRGANRKAAAKTVARKKATSQRSRRRRSTRELAPAVSSDYFQHETAPRTTRNSTGVRSLQPEGAGGSDGTQGSSKSRKRKRHANPRASRNDFEGQLMRLDESGRRYETQNDNPLNSPRRSANTSRPLRPATTRRRNRTRGVRTPAGATTVTNDGGLTVENNADATTTEDNQDTTNGNSGNAQSEENDNADGEANTVDGDDQVSTNQNTGTDQGQGIDNAGAGSNTTSENGQANSTAVPAGGANTTGSGSQTNAGTSSAVTTNTPGTGTQSTIPTSSDAGRGLITTSPLTQSTPATSTSAAGGGGGVLMVDGRPILLNPPVEEDFEVFQDPEDGPAPLENQGTNTQATPTQGSGSSRNDSNQENRTPNTPSTIVLEENLLPDSDTSLNDSNQENITPAATASGVSSGAGGTAAREPLSRSLFGNITRTLLGSRTTQAPPLNSNPGPRNVLLESDPDEPEGEGEEDEEMVEDYWRNREMDGDGGLTEDSDSDEDGLAQYYAARAERQARFNAQMQAYSSRIEEAHYQATRNIPQSSRTRELFNRFQADQTNARTAIGAAEALAHHRVFEATHHRPRTQRAPRAEGSRHASGRRQNVQGSSLSQRPGASASARAPGTSIQHRASMPSRLQEPAEIVDTRQTAPTRERASTGGMAAGAASRNTPAGQNTGGPSWFARISSLFGAARNEISDDSVRP